MSAAKMDPLTGILRLILAFIMGAIAFAMLMVAIGFVAVPFFQGEMTRELASASVGLPVWQVVLMIEAILAGVLVLLGLVEYFFLLLWRVLATVSQGDPFVPANSQRLGRMAWTALAGNIWAVVLTAYGSWFATFFPEEVSEADFEVDFGGGGVVLILVLFVLARVFRQGTEMRAELEGTV